MDIVSIWFDLFYFLN